MRLLEWIVAPFIDKRIASYQNDLMTKHCDEVQLIYQQMRGWRHDYHNHIQALKAHLTLGQMEEIENYLDQLDTDLTQVDTVVKTGNIMVDAILNSKISIAKHKGIHIHVKATVPKELVVSEIDLCIIIGNLLDNATEACLQVEREEERFLRIYIGIFKQQLYISIANAVGGEVKKVGSTYFTTKGRSYQEGGRHGFGLMRIDRMVDKYEGYINRQNEEGVFITEVMLPLASDSRNA